MTPTVLCAIDILDITHDTPVLEEALRQADLHNASLDILTVVPTLGMNLVSNAFDNNFQAEAVEEARKRLVKISEDILGKERKEASRHLVATGSAYEEILELAETTKPILIVIGSHKDSLKDLLLGPNAARVVRHAPCSVLVVRNGKSDSG